MWNLLAMPSARLIFVAIAVGLLTVCVTTEEITADDERSARIREAFQRPRESTPGVQVAFKEVSRGKIDKGHPQYSPDLQGTTTVTYVLKTTGFPQAKRYMLWQKRGFAQPEEMPGGPFEADSSGSLVSTAGRRLENVSIVNFGFVRGEPWEVAVISADHAIKAFAKVYPVPIEAKDGPCHVWLELGAANGELFIVLGRGFEPAEEVTFVARSNGEEGRRTFKIKSDGTFITIILPATIGKKYNASVRFIGRSCDVTLPYEWGPPALKQG